MEGDLRVAQGRVEELQAEVAALGGKEAQTSAESEKLKQDSLALQKQVDDAQQAIAEYREQAAQLAARLDAALGQAGVSHIMEQRADWESECCVYCLAAVAQSSSGREDLLCLQQF
jgi:chromosome segregation ATPase